MGVRMVAFARDHHGRRLEVLREEDGRVFHETASDSSQGEAFSPQRGVRVAAVGGARLG